MNKRVVLLTFLVIFALCCLAGCDILFGGETPGGAGDNQPHEHTGGTATCLKQAVCDICGKAYGDKAEHDYAEATCTTPEVCTVCRHTNGSPADHDYTEPTCTTASSCRFCGEHGVDALGHDIKAKVAYDSVSHWYECTRCNGRIGESNHTGGEVSCTARAKCSTCGVEYGLIANHDYTDATCTEGEICRSCGADGDGALGHSWESSISYNEDEHWYECATCGDKKEVGAHSGGNATETERAKCATCGQPYGPMIEITIDWQTEALAPLNGGVVVLANNLIRTWAQEYSCATADTNSHLYYEDVFTPDVPILKWKVGAEADYFKIYLSKNANMTGAQCYVTLSPELTVEHLEVARDYYWFVDAVYSTHTVRSEVFTFKTERTTRTVDIEGVSNARDIGGYVTLDGKQIKQGMIYRSAKLDDITELGKYTLVNILGVKTDLDLRGDKATQPVSELNHIATACPWYAHSDNGIFDSEANMTEFANTVKVFADINNYPIIFHCSLGRDRTGTLALVLEGLLGLDYETLMMEYELSVFSYWGSYGATDYKAQMTKQISDTYDYIHDNYEGDTFAEEVENFLLDIGVTAQEIASIRAIMLEEV